MSKDYLALYRDEPADLLHFGVKGMKWGVRRDSKGSGSSTVVSVDHLVNHTGPETSSQRYERIRTIAKAGRTKDLSDDDMRFFNNRSQAIQKVNAYTARKPHWAVATGSKVLQNTAMAVVGGVATAVAGKFITKPLIDAIGKFGATQSAKLAAMKVAKTTMTVGAAAKPFGSFA